MQPRSLRRSWHSLLYRKSVFETREPEGFTNISRTLSHPRIVLCFLAHVRPLGLRPMPQHLLGLTRPRCYPAALHLASPSMCFCLTRCAIWSGGGSAEYIASTRSHGELSADTHFHCHLITLISAFPLFVLASATIFGRVATGGARWRAFSTTGGFRGSIFECKIVGAPIECGPEWRGRTDEHNGTSVDARLV